MKYSQDNLLKVFHRVIWLKDNFGISNHYIYGQVGLLIEARRRELGRANFRFPSKATFYKLLKNAESDPSKLPRLQKSICHSTFLLFLQVLDEIEHGNADVA